MRVPKLREWDGRKLSQGYIADYKPFVFVDGEGVRCSLYTSGCLFACEGCFNTAAWSFRYGIVYDDALEQKILTDLAHESVQGLSLLGGEPFLNTNTCLRLTKRVRQEFGTKKDIWAWSGYTLEQLLKETSDKQDLLSYIDVLVDGPFLEAQKDLTLQFRGSSNQRILNVPESLETNSPVNWVQGLKSENF